MRTLTLNEKITIKGALARKGLRLPKLTTEEALFYWNICYGTWISDYHLIPPGPYPKS
jgi:hypothetical protein